MDTESLDSSKYLFTKCFEILSWRYRNYKSKVYDKVFGIIYRYSQLENGECTASVKDTLAPAIGVSEGLFGSTVRVLIEDELIIETARGNTNTYIPNLDKVEELYEEREAGKIYKESEHVTSTLERKKNKFNQRNQLRSHKSDVEATSIDQLRSHQQSYEVTGAKESDSYLRESLKDSGANSKSTSQASAFVDDLEEGSLSKEVQEIIKKFTSDAPQKSASTSLNSDIDPSATKETSSSGVDPSSLDEIIQDIKSKVNDFPASYILSLARDYVKQHPEYEKDINHCLDEIGF